MNAPRECSKKTELVKVTPNQARLLKLLDDVSPKQMKRSLRRLKNIVLYSAEAEIDKTDRQSCYLVNELEHTISKIAKETDCQKCEHRHQCSVA
ncbi:hypothetical protein [Flavobacterium sp.]|uniref:hypothetical protein n=1 Tax=Flavobacterium sp. TaxID=239 RepID=UPI00122B7D6F|nr:hypothetical protein [Flavobacterium sp.]RZJ71096.1 MAG: hypothetical protein EOO49_11625 [Flavobacterium sp.]